MTVYNQTYNFNQENMNFGKALLYGAFGSLTGGMGCFGGGYGMGGFGMNGSIFSMMGMGGYGFGGYCGDSMVGAQMGMIGANCILGVVSKALEGRGGQSSIDELETNISNINEKIGSQLDILNADGQSITESNYTSAKDVEEKYTKATTEANDNYNEANNYITNNETAYKAAKAKKNNNETLSENEQNIIKNYEEYKEKLPDLNAKKETAELNEINRKKDIKNAMTEIERLINERKQYENELSQKQLNSADGNSLQRISDEKYAKLLKGDRLDESQKKNVTKGAVRRAIQKLRNADEQDKKKYAQQVKDMYEAYKENQGGTVDSADLRAAYEIASKLI